MIKLEYVASGLSHTKITYQIVNNDPRLMKLFCSVARKLNSKYDTQKFGVLYNALTESKFYEVLERIRPHINSVHSDSGGLQIAQQNKILTNTLEKKIYSSQINKSDVAMSFDDMPIKVIDGPGDAKTMMSMKRFISEDVVRAGESSGKNIRRQIEYFVEHRDSNSYYHTRPLIVIQGNSDDDFKRYFDSIMSQIPQSLWKNIGGYAIAGSSIGIGTLEALDSIYSFAGLDKPTEISKKIHLLGYGSIKRLMPIIIAENMGVITDYDISYDSTSHTRKYNLGSVMNEKMKEDKFGLAAGNCNATRIFTSVYNMHSKEISEALDINKEYWIKTAASSLRGSERYHTNDTAALCHLSAAILCTTYTINNFMDTLQKIIIDPQQLLNYTKKEGSALSYILNSDCTSSEKWYKKTRDVVRRNLSSDRVERVMSADHAKTSTLDDLF